MGSLKSQTVKYGREYQGTRTWERLRWEDPAAYKKRQTRPLVREGAPQKQDRNCQIVIDNIWSWVPDGARHQDLVTDWPSIAMWLWLTWLWLAESAQDYSGKRVVSQPHHPGAILSGGALRSKISSLSTAPPRHNGRNEGPRPWGTTNKYQVNQSRLPIQTARLWTTWSQ
jgi:hypothetical protein